MIQVITSIIFSLTFFLSITNQYSIFQAYHYEIKKYFLYSFKKKIKTSIGLILVTVLSLLKPKISLECLTLSLIILLTNNEEKEHLKLTNRIKRFYLITIIALGIISLLINNCVVLNIICSLFYLLLSLIHFASVGIENLLLEKHKINAKKKIKDKVVIGITGSYGKTSCKNIIYDILSEKYNVSKTPKSYNNKVGIIKSINEELNMEDDYFICEYGVDKPHSMDTLINIVKPNVVLITGIGNQHLLGFKTRENIYKEKIKLAKCLKENEVVILNNDNDYLHDNKDKLDCKVITYGINNKSDIMAKNIEVNSKGNSFDLYINEEYIKHLKFNLLGSHNIMNLLGVIGVLLSTNMKLEDILKYIDKIKPIEHRLELKTIDNITIIDDAFNSNEEGFKNAIDVLHTFNEMKIVITPGIIEQGKNNQNLNYNLGKYMTNKVDLIILVNDNSTSIKQGLIDSKFDENKIIVKDSFIEAFKEVKTINKKEKIVLIENDLPCIYLK